MKFRPLAVPILLLSDSPELPTGLARVCRDLAGLLSTLPQFRVGTLGMGGTGMRKLGWTQYHFPESTGFGIEYLERVWTDFAGTEPGIIFTLWDASRCLWLGQPHTFPTVQKFLGPGRTMQLWGYFPLDSTGPNEITLPQGQMAAVSGYDRVLAASEWGRNLLRNSGRADADWIPHGLWSDKFQVGTKAKALLDWEDKVVLGCVMANQARKDWPVAFETAAILRRKYGNRLRFWAHTDLDVRYWNFYALAADYGIGDCLEVTTSLSDHQLAVRYSGCDVTILPTAGEGFGFPIAESLLCGTACVTTNYAAGGELVPEDCRIDPIAYRIDTSHNCMRAVLSGHGFARAAEAQIERARLHTTKEEVRDRAVHLGWDRLQHVWTKWLLRGVGQ